MDKRFEDIQLQIDQQSQGFLLYLKTFVLDETTWDILQIVAQQTYIYVFSGVIRNYLLGFHSNRDIDFVVVNLDHVHIPPSYKQYIRYRKNSFGGYKLSVNNLTIDVWDIRKSWAMLVNRNLRPTPYTLIKTVFFNFSAIVYDVRRRRFIYDDAFLSFYSTRIMDVVNEINPNPALCIVSTMHYASTYGLGMNVHLCRWIVEHNYPHLNYELAQLNHYHTIIYSNDKVAYFIAKCKAALSHE